MLITRAKGLEELKVFRKRLHGDRRAGGRGAHVLVPSVQKVEPRTRHGRFKEYQGTVAPQQGARVVGF